MTRTNTVLTVRKKAVWNMFMNLESSKSSLNAPYFILKGSVSSSSSLFSSIFNFPQQKVIESF